MGSFEVDLKDYTVLSQFVYSLHKSLETNIVEKYTDFLQDNSSSQGGKNEDYYVDLHKIIKSVDSTQGIVFSTKTLNLFLL